MNLRIYGHKELSLVSSDLGGARSVATKQQILRSKIMAYIYILKLLCFNSWFDKHFKTNKTNNKTEIIIQLIYLRIDCQEELSLVSSDSGWGHTFDQLCVFIYQPGFP